MKVGDEVRTAVVLPGIATGTRGLVKEIGRLFVVVAFQDGRQGYYARRQLEPAISCQSAEQSTKLPLVVLGMSNTRLPRGSHGCLLPCHKSTAINTVAHYLGAGLAAGETVICWFPAKWQDNFLRCLRQLGVDSSLALQDRKLTILNPYKVYLQESEFTAGKQLERTATAVSALAKDHPEGVRLFGYAGRRFVIEGWWEYESRYTPIARALGVTTLCGYSDFGERIEPWRRAAETHTYLIKDGQVTAGGQTVAEIDLPGAWTA